MARTLLATACAAALGGAAVAQSASEIVKPSYEPPQQRLTGALVFSGAPGLAPPPGAERLSILLAGVSVLGALPGTDALVAKLRARLTGHRIAVAEIFAAAAELEAAYVKAGYVLSRVVIPAQTLVDGGSLRLQVINGFVEKIDDSNVPPAIRPRLKELTDPLIGKPGLKLADIERRLLLAGDTYGVALGSALAAGATPGGTVIVLDPQFRRITGFVGLDNTFSEGLGIWNFSGGLEFNGYLGMGEVFYLRGSGHPVFGGDDGWFGATPRLRTLAAGAVFPIGSDGLTFNIEATQSKTRPKPDTAFSGTASAFDRLSMRLFYPWVRSSRRNLSVQLAFDIARDRLDLLTPFGDFGLSEDRTRVLRLSMDGTWIRDSGAVIEAGVKASLGIDGLGARGRDDATPALPLSRDGADAAFHKLEVSGRYRRKLGKTFAVSLAGRAQTSFGQPLLSSEQFGIASVQDLSPFDEGALSGDAGWVVRAELSRPFAAEAFGRPLQISPYVFGAIGEVTRERPSVDEAARVGANAYGIGTEITLIRDPKYSSASLRIEYGMGNRDDDGEDASRLTIVGSFRF